VAARKESRSLADLISDVAYRKRRAAQARFAGTPPGQESPRDVYLAACASISSYFEESFGFKYTKSGPHARRRSGDVTFEIGFQSSRHNIPGEHVNLHIHGNVRSARIKKWRESQPLLKFLYAFANDFIAGGQIGDLQSNHPWIEWELADAGTRDEVIRDAIRAVDGLALPYFAKFEDLPSLFTLLVNEDLPGMTIDRVVEFLLCFADHSTAWLAATSFLGRRRDLVRAYERSFERYAEHGLDSEHPSGFAMQLAFASHAFQFGDLTVERA
jgi:hypothetical protein